MIWHVFNSRDINEIYELKLFGSSFTGLAIRGDGDLDYSICLPESNIGDNKILNYISKGLNGKDQYHSHLVNFSIPRV